MRQKILSKFKDKNLLRNLLLVFLIIQPILDLSILYSDGIMALFKFSPSTILRMAMVAVLLIMVVYLKGFKKQEKGMLVCFGLIGVYSIIHIMNVLTFDANLTGTFKFSFVQEAFYIARMAIPIMIMYLTININITKKDFKNAVLFTVATYSGVIILANILKVGYSTYGDGKILYNIFEWSSNLTEQIADKATKGLFIGGNRLGVLLSALLPFTLLYYFKDRGFKLLIVNFLAIVALIMVGTRVSTYLWMPIIALVALVYYGAAIMKKEKINTKKLVALALMILIIIPILIVSPVRSKIYGSEYRKQFDQIFRDKEYSKQLSDISAETEEGLSKKAEFVGKNYGDFNLSQVYVEELYSYKADPDFWISVMMKDYDERDNGRKIQLLISQRIQELNGNKFSDSLLGMGYSVFKSSDIYVERDFVVQYFTMGILGIILFIGPYIFVLVRAALFILKDIKNRLRRDLLIYCMSLCVFLFSSVMCGHILDEMITYIFMAVISGFILKEIAILKKQEQVKIEDKISVIIPVYNTEQYLRECLDSVVKQDIGIENLEVILVNDSSTDNSLAICKEYVEKYNFKLIDNNPNKGQAISRNEAIKIATGNYIAFLDSDDYWKENNLSKLYKTIKAEEADIAIARLDSFNSKGRYGYYSDKYIDVYAAGDIFANPDLINCISICSRLYKTELIKNITFLENTIHEDNSFSLTSMFKAEKMVVIPEYLYKRRIREDNSNASIMQKLNYKTFKDLIKNYEEVLSNIKTTKSLDFLYKYMIKQLNNNVIKHVSEEEKAKAYEDIDKFINTFEVKNKASYIRYSKMYLKIADFGAKLLKKR